MPGLLDAVVDWSEFAFVLVNVIIFTASVAGLVDRDAAEFTLLIQDFPSLVAAERLFRVACQTVWESVATLQTAQIVGVLHVAILAVTDSDLTDIAKS